MRDASARMKAQIREMKRTSDGDRSRHATQDSTSTYASRTIAAVGMRRSQGVMQEECVRQVCEQGSKTAMTVCVDQLPVWSYVSVRSKPIHHPHDLLVLYVLEEAGPICPTNHAKPPLNGTAPTPPTISARCSLCRARKVPVPIAPYTTTARCPPQPPRPSRICAMGSVHGLSARLS